VSKDIQLIRWSNVLAAMAILAAVITLIGMAYPLFFGGAVALAKDHGATFWSTPIGSLPLFERSVVMFITYLDSFAWLYAVRHILLLASNYRTGRVFGEANARSFMRIGVALGLIGVFNTLTYPFLNYFLFWRGVSPWLGDLSWLHLVQPNYLTAGLFFFILGKIMRRAGELEESDRLMI
jgi:hypothetical protein